MMAREMRWSSQLLTLIWLWARWAGEYTEVVGLTIGGTLFGLVCGGLVCGLVVVAVYGSLCVCGR
jgi:hypothetical protein